MIKPHSLLPSILILLCVLQLAVSLDNQQDVVSSLNSTRQPKARSDNVPKPAAAAAAGNIARRATSTTPLPAFNSSDTKIVSEDGETLNTSKLSTTPRDNTTINAGQEQGGNGSVPATEERGLLSTLHNLNKFRESGMQVFSTIKDAIDKKPGGGSGGFLSQLGGQGGSGQGGSILSQLGGGGGGGGGGSSILSALGGNNRETSNSQHGQGNHGGHSSGNYGNNDDRYTSSNGHRRPVSGSSHGGGYGNNDDRYTSSGSGGYRPVTGGYGNDRDQYTHSSNGGRNPTGYDKYPGSASSISSTYDKYPNSQNRPTNANDYGYGQGDNGGYSGGQSSRPTRPINGQHDLEAQSSGDSNRRYPLNEKNCGMMYATRIVGGDLANPEDFLWMVAMIRASKSNTAFSAKRPFCGGTLITRRHIMTAAHCLEGLSPRDVLVRLGNYEFEDSSERSRPQEYQVDMFRVPASYSKKTHEADIAIMRLKNPLPINDNNYRTVCMPMDRHKSYVGALGTITGYGSRSEHFQKSEMQLRQVTVPVWENRRCGQVYKKEMGDSFLCAGLDEGGKDACQGDSGGPLVVEGPNERMLLAGVVSHGIGCGSPGYPGVYTRVSHFMDWIEKNTRD